MYLKSEDEERDLIEQAIQEAQIAEKEQTTSLFAKAMREVKSWFSKSNHNNDHADPTSGAQAMS